MKIKKPKKKQKPGAARIWLRNVSSWCFKSEAICKHIVSEQYIATAQSMGICDSIEDAMVMLESATMIDVLVTLNATYDLSIRCYDVENCTFVNPHVGKEANAQNIVSGKDACKVLDMFKSGNEDDDKKYLKSLKVRNDILNGVAGKNYFNEIALADNTKKLDSNNSHKNNKLNATESKRFRKFLRTITKQLKREVNDENTLSLKAAIEDKIVDNFNATFASPSSPEDSYVPGLPRKSSTIKRAERQRSMAGGVDIIRPGTGEGSKPQTLQEMANAKNAILNKYVGRTSEASENENEERSDLYYCYASSLRSSMFDQPAVIALVANSLRQQQQVPQPPS